MSEIKVGENETLENALRRFKRKCARAGVLSEERENTTKSQALRKRRNQKLLERESSNRTFFLKEGMCICQQ